MSTLILDKVLSGYNLAKVNDNFERIEKAFNEALLHRDGSKELLDDLDVNSQKLLNVGGIEIGGVDIVESIASLQEEYNAYISTMDEYKSAVDEILEEAISYGAVDQKNIGNAQRVFTTSQTYAVNSNMTLPLPYVVGKNTLKLNLGHYYELYKGVDYEEVGVVGNQSTTIKLLRTISSGVEIEEFVDGDNDLYSIYATAEALQELLTTSYSPESIEEFVNSVSDIQELGLEDKIAQLNSLYNSLVSLQTDLQTTVADINTKYSTITDMYEDVGTKYSLLETLYPQLLALLADTDFDLDGLNEAVGELNTAISDLNDLAPVIEEYKDDAETAATSAESSASSASTSATSAANSASSAAGALTNAQIWAEGTDGQVEQIGGEHSSKGWANQARTARNEAVAAKEDAEEALEVAVSGIPGLVTQEVNSRDIPGQVASAVTAQDIPQQVAAAVTAQDIPGQVEDEVTRQNTQALRETVEGLVSDALDEGLIDALGYTPADAADLDAEARAREAADVSLQSAVDSKADDDEVVKHVSQSLTATQKSQARSNISAQETLTFDSAPTDNSANPVTSAGIKTALDNKQNRIPLYNVVDYGARSGTANDSTAGIQAALTAAYNAGGGVVVIPKGNYKVTAQLYIGANTQLVGLGNPFIYKSFGVAFKTLLTNQLGYTSNNYPSGYNGHSNILVKGFTFYGEFFDSTEGGKLEYCLSFVNAQNITVEDCTFRNWNHCHLTEFSGIRNGTVRRCHYFNLKFDQDGVDAGTYHYNEIIQLDPNTEGSYPASKHDSTSNTNILIEDCSFGALGTAANNSYGYAIGTHGSSDTQQQNIVIRNCIIANATYGLRLNNYKQVTVENCKINAANYGIWVAPRAGYTFDDLVVDGNRVYAGVPIRYDYSASGIRGSRHKIVNNAFMGTDTTDAVFIQDISDLFCVNNSFNVSEVNFSGCSTALIENNAFNNNQARTSSLGAVNFRESVNNTPYDYIFANNSIRNAVANRGLNVSSGNQIRCFNNAFIECTPVSDSVASYTVYAASSTVSFSGNYSNYSTSTSSMFYGDASSTMREVGANFSANGRILSTNQLGKSLAKHTSIEFDAYNSSNQHIVFPVTSTAGLFTIAKKDESDVVTRLLYVDRNGAFRPNTDGSQALGWSNTRWSAVYASTGSINTSDERLKTSIRQIDDAVLDAWGKVNLVVFRFKDAVEKKGQDARLHMGMVAQQVKAAFEEMGLDAFRFGLLCYDEWEDEYEDVEVVDQEEVLDEEGNVIQERQVHTEQRLVQSAGDRYSIRYDEALVLEAAYQRRRADRIEARLSALEERLGE